jgi:hypothetical protein
MSYEKRQQMRQPLPLRTRYMLMHFSGHNSKLTLEYQTLTYGTNKAVNTLRCKFTYNPIKLFKSYIIMSDKQDNATAYWKENQDIF